MLKLWSLDEFWGPNVFFNFDVSLSLSDMIIKSPNYKGGVMFNIRISGYKYKKNNFIQDFFLLHVYRSDNLYMTT